jgi:hypothetical protein
MSNYIIWLSLAMLLGLTQTVKAQNCIEGDCVNGQGTLVRADGIKYVGQFKNGKFHGIGICYWPDGGRYQGEWKAGYPHGQGSRLLGDGIQQTGRFERGRFLSALDEPSLTGKGGARQRADAPGCISGNCYDGLGVFIFGNGAIYTGTFDRGEINGQGICHYPDGSKYEGEWENALPHGSGKMTSPGGQEESGQWYRGQLVRTSSSGHSTSFAMPARQTGCLSGNCTEGRGVKSYQDGSRYEGTFKDHQPHGEGIFRYPNGDKYEGHFRQGMPHGKGTMHYADGQIQQGHWIDGEFVGRQAQARKGCIDGDCENGSGTYIFSDGNKYVGHFQSGLPHGKGTVFYQDGRRYEGEMANGYLNGYGTLFTKNKRQISGYWKDGVYQPERQVQSPPTAPDQEDEPEAPDLQVWAVIIGVADYDHMRVLRYPDDDAYRMYAFLKSPEGGALDDDHIKILVDEEATLSNIKRVTGDVFAKAGPNDLIMLYFSGHGVPGAFLPADFMGGTRNQLLHEDLMAILRRSQAKHKLFLADACHSGSMLTARGGRPREEKNQAFFKKLYATAPSTAFIVSSKSNEISVESSGLRQGVFSHFLIRGLKGEADANRDRYVDVTELYRYVRYNVREYTGNKQSPLIEGQYDPNMPVSVH